jgi:diguanylate cyclase (GGDEF)-like protein
LSDPFSLPPRAIEAAMPKPPSGPPEACDDLECINRAIKAVGEACYHWRIEDDVLRWSDNATAVLGCDSAALASGRAFASFLDPENFTSRYDTVMRSSLADQGDGVPFQIEYQFRPEGRSGRAHVWVEDHGRWFAGPDGRPIEVYGTVRRIDDRHKRDQQLSFLGNCDPLTGMMNRGRLAEALGEAMTVAAREGSSCAFVIAAINNLAVVNEAFGFEVADEVIVKMGRRLRQVVRAGDAIARYSGSKFGLILNGCDEDELGTAIERFLGVARESVIETERGPVWALLSIGALVLPKHASDANSAMAHAEEALTEARKFPSDGHVIYRPSEERSAERRRNAHSATEIVRCLREDRFLLAFQPVVSASTRKPVFHEALLRLRDAEGEIIAAAHLIPMAEKLGLVRLIDRAVVQMAIATLHSYPEARLSLNISGITATDPRWYPQITAILASNPGVTDRLIIEITETAALSDLAVTRHFVEELRELGCSVAIDDFGAGFTSFRNLRHLPVDILKLDGSFCHDLASNADNQYFVRTLIDLARNFDLQTVAEWVQNEEDAQILQDWGVDFMQGIHFGEASLDLPWQAGVGAEPFITSAISEPPSAAGAATVEAAQPVTSAAPETPDVAPDVAVIEAAAEAEVVELTESPGEPSPDPVKEFESGLDDELAKLRAAIAALDASFKPKSEASAEPSFADLVSDTAARAAG